MSHILHIITGLSDGGAEAALYRLCTSDLAHRHQVVSLTSGDRYGPLLEAKGIAVTCLGMRRGRVSASGLWRLWRLIRSQRPEVVQTWMYHADLLGGVVARLAGRRNLCWGIRHSTLDPKASSRSTILVARLSARLSRLVPRRIICCAEAARAVHADLGYDAARMLVIPNGYDLSVFRPNPAAGAAARLALGIAPEQRLIGYVARFDPQKDHATLLSALALLQKRGQAPLCLLIGTGIEARNTALLAQISALGLTGQVRLLGRRSDIPALMNALDLHVMSSSFGEAFPNVLAEAMACGTPCVSTDVGDAAAIVGTSGRIVPPRQPVALASAIADLLEARGGPDWPARQAAARAHVSEQFGIERMVQSYHQVWFDGAGAVPRAVAVPEFEPEAVAASDLAPRGVGRDDFATRGVAAFDFATRGVGAFDFATRGVAGAGRAVEESGRDR